MRVLVLSRHEIKDGRGEGAAGVISIRPTAPTSEPQFDAALHEAVLGDVGAILQMRFDDIGLEGYGPYRGPTLDHVAEAIAFGRRFRSREINPLIVVH